MRKLERFSPIRTRGMPMTILITIYLILLNSYNIQIKMDPMYLRYTE